ncbi:MAG: DUF2165 family protein [Pseudomonadota bacterium]|nr:DUF2165 family protein [Pseudomonadota bacterium]
MDALVLFGLALLTAITGAWIGIGVAENIRFPKVNGDLVTMVMRMDRVREERPEIYADVKGNRVDNAAVHAWAYRAIVAFELLATGLLLLGAVLLLGAAFGAMGGGAETAASASLAAAAAAPGALPGEGARMVAAAGALAFCAVWGGFLVGGQWFHYWAGWKDSQFTHFFLLVWGAILFGLLT